MTVVLITHEVNEAVRLADQVLVLGNAKILDTLSVDLPHPRAVADLHVIQYAANVLNLLTNS